MNLRDVIKQMEQLTQDGYIFRGHESVKYQLEPNAFRDQSIARMKKQFAISPIVIQQWCNSEKINSTIRAWYSTDPIHFSHPTISRLKNFCLYLMIYNHALHLFVHKFPHRVAEQDKALFLLRDVEFWRQEETFQYLFESYLPRIINRWCAKEGTLIQKANPFEDLAGVDETLPQHYGIPTAALDWSFNFNVAIYFAMGEDEYLKTNFFSIFALKINDVSSPIKTIDGNIQIENIRAERQKGTFSYFEKPCSFYLEHGFFPTINDFNQRQKNHLDKRTFELKEYRIERTESNIRYLKGLLDGQGISKQYLFPDLLEQAEPIS